MKIDNRANSTTFGYRVKYYSTKDVHHAAAILKESAELRAEFKNATELAKKAYGLKSYAKLKAEQPELVKAFDSGKDKFAHESEAQGLKGDIYITGFDFVNGHFGKVTSFLASVSSSNAKKLQSFPIHLLIDGNGPPKASDPYMRSFDTKRAFYRMLNNPNSKEREKALSELSENIYKGFSSLQLSPDKLAISGNVIAKDASPAYVKAIAKQEREINRALEDVENNHDELQELYNKKFNRTYFEKKGEPIAHPTGKGVKNSQRYKMIERKDSNKNKYPYKKTEKLHNGTLVETFSEAPKFDFDKMLKGKSKTKKLAKSELLNTEKLPPHMQAIRAMERAITRSLNNFNNGHAKQQKLYEKHLGVSREELAKENLNLSKILGSKRTNPTKKTETQIKFSESRPDTTASKSKKAQVLSDKPKLTKSEILAQKKAEQKAQKKAVVAAAKANKPLHPNNTQILNKKHRDKDLISMSV